MKSRSGWLSSKIQNIGIIIHFCTAIGKPPSWLESWNASERERENGRTGGRTERHTHAHIQTQKVRVSETTRQRQRTRARSWNPRVSIYFNKLNKLSPNISWERPRSRCWVCLSTVAVAEEWGHTILSCCWCSVEYIIYVHSMIMICYMKIMINWSSRFAVWKSWWIDNERPLTWTSPKKMSLAHHTLPAIENLG